MDESKLLEDCVEEINIEGVKVKSLTREAEVVVVATHAIYKEYMYLLADYFTVKYWLSRESMRIAKKHDVLETIEISLHINKSIEAGAHNAPVRLNKGIILKTYLNKAYKDRIFRATSLNIAKYISKKDFGRKLFGRLIRRSY